LLAAILLGVTAWWARRLHAIAGPVAATNSVVVLPLQELSPDGANTSLRFELADDISDRLVKAPGIEVRPLADPKKYAAVGSDPQQAAHEANAAQVVTGHLVRDRDNLVVTLMAIDAGTNRVRWQKTLTVDAKQSRSPKIADSLMPELMEAVRK
jgi:TolB-like protein